MSVFDIDRHRGRRHAEGHPYRPWGSLGRYDYVMSDMDRQLSTRDRDLSRGFGGLVVRTNEMGMGFLSPQTESEYGGEEGNEPGKYGMNIFLGHQIGPQDVKVSCKNNVMTVDAKKEYKSDDGNARVYQEYMRRFTLPTTVDMKELKSELTPEGYLRIEAPLHPEALQQAKQPQAIPIKRE